MDSLVQGTTLIIFYMFNKLNYALYNDVLKCFKMIDLTIPINILLRFFTDYLTGWPVP